MSASTTTTTNIALGKKRKKRTITFEALSSGSSATNSTSSVSSRVQREPVPPPSKSSTLGNKEKEILRDFPNQYKVVRLSSVEVWYYMCVDCRKKFKLCNYRRQRATSHLESSVHRHAVTMKAKWKKIGFGISTLTPPPPLPPRPKRCLPRTVVSNCSHWHCRCFCSPIAAVTKR